jgi:UDP-N-acetylmuramoylalanine--D-glutamate ligase
MPESEFWTVDDVAAKGGFFGNKIVDRGLSISFCRAGHAMKQSRSDTQSGLKDKKVLIVGLARTGLAAGRFLVNRGARVTAADLMTKEQLGVQAEEAAALGISLQLGPHDPEVFLSQDLIVVSPGVPETIAPLQAAKRNGIPVVGELELAAGFIAEPIVAVTGTNGKTTTTHLIGEMFKASKHRAFVGGNIGNPLIEYLDRAARADVVVAEVSSFQLDTMVSFRPKVGVLLNISEDHLDRYKNFQGYIHSKARLFENQEKSDFAVLNAGDPGIQGVISCIRSQRLYFNGDPGKDMGSELRNGMMICRLPGALPYEFDLSGFQLRGKHNLENACAASLAALAAGVSAEAIQKVLKTFEGLHHRIEHVRTLDGVHYYNDSKGTNVAAVVRALESFDVPVILIMGGRDKGGDYTVLREPLRKRVKKLIVTGEAKEKILAVLGKTTISREAADLQEAVVSAHQAADPGEVVLLSPGCSSFDMFANYAERGEAFCRAVHSLENDV